MPEILVLIDGSALAHRSYFAFAKNPLYNSKGENTGAVFGFTNSLLKILEEFEPSHAAVCFDTAAPTFRHEKFPDYKATREKMDPEMRNQMPTIYDVTEALGVPVVQLDGFEADDIMGTLATRGSREGYSVYLVSGDKDFLQLVSDNVKVVSPGRTGSETVTYDSKRVTERFEVPPEKVADVLALAGDKVDNVPGVRGIGLKGAAKLIQAFGSVEELLEDTSRIDGSRLREKIEESREELLVFKELVRIHTDTPLDVELDDLVRRERDGVRLRHLFRELEFFSLMKRLAVDSKIDDSYNVVDDPEEAKGMLRDGGAIGLFVMEEEGESDGGLAVSQGRGECCFLPFSMLEESGDLLSVVNSLLASGQVTVVTEDVKRAVGILRKRGIELNPPFIDVSVASYLMDPDRRDHGLAFHLERELGLSLPPLPSEAEEDTSAHGRPGNQTVTGACSRADGARRLKEPFEGKLKEQGLWMLYEEVELPLVQVLADMERVGVLIDVEFLQRMSDRMADELKVIEEEIYTQAGERFNIRSSKQLANILFEKLGLPSGRRTKTGYSTSQDQLERLSEEHELPASVLKYRELYKLKSTYVDVLPGLVSPESGRIHTTFKQTVAATGRLSSSDPNLQNIPMRTEMGREIRKGFIAAGGNVLLSVDYSQVELRILAHLTREESLVEAFEQRRDIHTETAAIVFGVRAKNVTEKMRNTAKMVNYGLVYGMSSYGLSQRLSIGKKEAQQFMDAYFEGLPRVKDWIDVTVASAQEKGYTTTMLGRRRYHRDINSRDANRREVAMRAAVNSPIQGSAADMIKAAMVDIQRQLRSMTTSAKMIVQIHDELLFEVAESEVESLAAMVSEKMVNALALDVPVEVEAGHGSDWYTAHR